MKFQTEGMPADIPYGIPAGFYLLNRRFRKYV